MSLADKPQEWRDQLRAAEHDVVSAVAHGRDLADILEVSCRKFEELDPSSKCSILLLDASRTKLRKGAAPSLPAAYSDALQDLPIGPDVGCCGTAAYTRQTVVTYDIATDPKWVKFRDLALSHGLASCWSIPLLDESRAAVGTFAIYHHAPHQPSGAEVGAATVMSDAVAVAIARRRDHERLVEARLEAESANIAKSNFLTHLSHEFRTPLNAIIGFADLLASPSHPAQSAERTREYARNIGDSGKLLLELIDGLLDLARVEAGQVAIDDEVFDVAEVLVQCLGMIRATTPLSGPRLVFDNQAPGVSLTADRRAVIRMALNLLSNGVKFTAPDGAVTLVLSVGDAGLVIRVLDDGPGIAADDLPRLGMPFTRSTRNTARRVSGTGLGLFITRSLIELHGGRLVISNRDGGGADAAVIFPPSRVVGG
jgi:two-component system cell cycle sensor histidine kinase PleC